MEPHEEAKIAAEDANEARAAAREKREQGPHSRELMWIAAEIRALRLQQASEAADAV